MSEKDSIENVLNNSIQAAVISALGGREALVREMVKLALEKKVDNTGQVPKYGSGDYTYIEWLARNGIEDAVRTAFYSLISEQNDLIVEQVKNELTLQNDSLAKSLVTGLVNHVKATGEYSIKINLEKDY